MYTAMFYSPEDIVKEVYTSTIRLRLLKNSIIHYTFLENADLDLEEAIHNHEVYNNFKTGVHPLLVDSENGFVTPSRKYADYIKSREPFTPLIGRAIVSDSLAHKLLLSVYYKVTDTLYPIKIFSNYEDAQAWLLKLLKEQTGK